MQGFKIFEQTRLAHGESIDPAETLLSPVVTLEVFNNASEIIQ